jgi:hypothetical protein
MKRPAKSTAVVYLVAIALLGCSDSDTPITAPSDGESVTTSPAPPPEPNAGLTMLPIRALQQTTSYTCGPAAIVSLLSYYDRDGNELAIADDAKCTPEKGTSPENMVAWLQDNGFHVSWGEHGSLALLRANLERGVPTLVEWIDYGGHWVLVVGYDTRGTEAQRDDVIYFADPADGHDGNRDGLTSFNADRFDAMWFDAFLFERPMFKIYITATPLESSEGL